MIVEIEGDCEIETASNNTATLIDINNVDEQKDGHMTIKGVGDKPASLTITSNNNAGAFGIAGPDVRDDNVNNGVLAIENLALNISGKSIGIGVNELTINNSNVYVEGIIRSKTSMKIDGSTVIANTTIENPDSAYKNTIGTEGTLTIINGSEIYAYNSVASQYDSVAAATVHIIPVQKAAFENGKLKWAGYLDAGSMSVVASYTNNQFVNAVLSSPTSSAGYKMLEFLLSDYGSNSKLMFVNAQSYQPIYKEIVLKN